MNTKTPHRLPRKAAADYLGLSRNTLARWAVEGTYQLPYYRIGNRTVYDVSDLDAFLAKRRVTFTGDDDS
jgi:excisionase family DNA binding protein